MRASGAGLGCPDWPRCFGSWIPPASAADLPPQFDPSQFNPTLMWTEYLNRLLGVTVGFLIFATAISAWRHHRHQPRILWTTIAAFLLVGFRRLARRPRRRARARGVDRHRAPDRRDRHRAAAAVRDLRSVRDRAGTVATARTHRGARLVAMLALIVLTLVQAGFGTQVRGHIDAALDAGVARDVALATVGRLDYLHRDLAFVVLIGATALDALAAVAAIAAGSLVFRRPGARGLADRARRGDGVWFAVTGRAGRASNHRQPAIGRGNGVVAHEPEAERMRVQHPSRRRRRRGVPGRDRCACSRQLRTAGAAGQSVGA